MTNLWSFLLQTLHVTAAALLLLLVKAILHDKLSPRWQYGIWAVLGGVLVLPANLLGRHGLFDFPLWVETAKTLAAQGKTRPGILATDGTIQTGLYQKEFAAFGIEAVVPTAQTQELVMSLIYDDVKAGRDGDPQKFAAIHKELLAQGCDCGVLACTELSVFASQHHLPHFYTDAMAVLAERAVEACRKPLRTIFIK